MAEAKKSRKKSDDKVTIDNLGAGLGNKPPQAVDFEEAVLGALLIDANCVEDVMEELEPNCFYEPRNRPISEAMSSMSTSPWICCPWVRSSRLWASLTRSEAPLPLSP